jgi:hypothetical protein
VGKKTDRTLLAVGRLYNVDPDPNNPTNLTTIITSTSKSVTFMVHALEAGVKYPDIANSSFLTAALDTTTNYTNVSYTNTDVQTLSIKERNFPVFKLTKTFDSMRARYEFRVTGGSFEEYRRGIILARQGHGPDGNFYEKKQPRYPIQGQGFQGYSLRLDDKTEITPLNNNLANVGSPIEHPLEFQFDTRGTVNGSVFTLVFAIPIYPLSADENPGMWYLRPSYDSYLLDIDDGKGGTGGAVLIGTGEIEPPSGYRIRIVVPPLKWLYNNDPPDPPPYPPNDINKSRIFDITDLVVHMETTDEPPQFIEVIDNSKLTFFVAYPAYPGIPIGDQIYGIQLVLVNYVDPDSGITHSDMFVIIVDDGAWNYTDIPKSHYYVVTADNNTASNGIQAMLQAGGAGTYVIIATTSFNFDVYEGIEIPFSGPNDNFLIFVLAGTRRNDPDVPESAVNPNVRIGKIAPIAFRSYRSNNSFFFGTWPFNYNIVIDNTSYPPGLPAGYYGTYSTFPYILNAGGTWQQIAAGGNPGEWTAPSNDHGATPTNGPRSVGGNRFLADNRQVGGAGFGRVWNVTADDPGDPSDRDWGAYIVNYPFLY